MTAKKVLISVDRRFRQAESFVAKIKEFFPLTKEMVVDDSVFSRDEVIKKLQGDYQIYIFIGHGVANSKQPERSYIEISATPRRGAGAKIIQLNLDDLKKINWANADMVMLIGCETAHGRLYLGTGVSSLGQGFISLGVKNVLGNSWEVDAGHAITQAQNFLTAWVATSDPARALRESQLQAIRELEDNAYYQYPLPYLWGGSVLFTAK